jgi:predicted RNA-binding protein
MDSKEKAIKLVAEAEGIISNARDVMDDKKHFHLTGELLAIDTILSNILKSQRQGF